MNRFSQVLARVRPAVQRHGWDVVRYPGSDFAYMRSRFLERSGVDLVIDVGANTGQYGRLIRDHGYRASILSFEPMSHEFVELSMHAAKDDAWTAHRLALGSDNDELPINIAGNSISSSLLPMLPRHVDFASHSAYVDVESVAVRRLDEVARDRVASARAPYLKIDTQGFEIPVLEGASESLPRMAGVELEMSLVPLYEGQGLLEDVLERMRGAGFVLHALSPGLVDSDTGETLQVDGIFKPAASLSV